MNNVDPLKSANTTSCCIFTLSGIYPSKIHLHASTAHLNALADIYKQRAAIEAAYADGLHKLARTAEQGGLTGKAGNDWPRGSGEDRLWDSVLSELAEVRPAPSSCACN